MGVSFAFLFCTCRGSKDAHRFAVYLFRKLVFWYTLNMNEMYAGNNILRRFSDMFQGSLSLYPTEFSLGLLEPSLLFLGLFWPLLSISVAFLNIVTSKERKEPNQTVLVALTPLPPQVSLHRFILPQLSLFPLSLQVPFYITLNMA